jgi:methionyl-tRNA formyltransferase
MEKKDLRIVFMGTPDFAVTSLKALVDGGYNVVGVITMPDKPAGRGYKLQCSPVKEYALECNIPVLQPEKLKNPAFLDDLKALNADLQVVVAFRMLPEVVWNMPRFGTFNLHGSLLPQYRGAAPINWAIINGETETGVTTFFLTHEIDTGRVIFQKKIEIADTDDVEIVHDALMAVGAELVCQTVDAVIVGKIDSIPQDQLLTETTVLNAAPKIFKETCRIDWNKGAKKVYDFVRGLSPYPAAWSEFRNHEGVVFQIKVYSTEKRFIAHQYASGSVQTDGKTFFDVAVSDGYIRILTMQLAGKKRMNIDEFLRGFKLTGELVFTT